MRATQGNAGTSPLFFLNNRLAYTVFPPIIWAHCLCTLSSCPFSSLMLNPTLPWADPRLLSSRIPTIRTQNSLMRPSHFTLLSPATPSLAGFQPRPPILSPPPVHIRSPGTRFWSSLGCLQAQQFVLSNELQSLICAWSPYCGIHVPNPIAILVYC